MHPFLTTYTQIALPRLKEHKQYASPYLIPRISKVSVNMGVGDLEGKAIDEASQMITQITGQKPVQCKARKAISGFKIRQGMVVGLKVTLRGERMHDFLSKLTQVALPRTRDFRGIPETSVTADGTLNVGIRDSSIFPENNYGSLTHPLQVTLVSNATNREEARLMYESLGFVFQSADERVVKKKSHSIRKRK